jgi:2,3-bisphosphoglycerate-dependent phosphoglycerate mutase
MSIGKLILLRHGESEWNAKNLFTGWVDVRLSERGEKEARRGGELLKEHNLLPDVLFTPLRLLLILVIVIGFQLQERGD